MGFKVLTVIGTRPEIIKMAPLIEVLNQNCDHFLLHSGQHYSPEMDRLIFEDLDLPEPQGNLLVGSCPPAEQVARIAMGVEQQIRKEQPQVVVVHGDTNTTLGAAIAASKYKAAGVMLAHVESGCRSFIPTEAEEINRKMVDQISDFLFAANEKDREHLLAENLPEDRILVTGNTVLETSRRMQSRLDEDWLSHRFQLDRDQYLLSTFHRQETVDDPRLLASLVEEIRSIATRIPVVVPLHPRTRNRLAEFSLKLEGERLRIIEPVGYKDMISLLDGAHSCITDSGGLQEEAAVLGTPAFVLREQTEHRRYVEAGIHTLVGPPFQGLSQQVHSLWDDREHYQRRRDSFQLDGEPQIAHQIYQKLHDWLGLNP